MIRSTSWQTLLEGTEHYELIDVLVAQFNFNPSALQTIAVTLQQSATTETVNSTQWLWNQCCSLARPWLDHLAQPIDLKSVWTDLILPTEQHQVLQEAETGGVILLFDEADAIFGKRTEVKDSHDRHANVKVSYLLQRMEAYQGLAILTTNFKENMDIAFLRRLRFVVTFPFPDAKARAEIWQRVFPNQMPQQGLDPVRLAQLKVAGGSIRNMALNAAMRAAEAGEAVMMMHLLAAAKRECVKLEKTLSENEIGDWV